MQVDQAPRISAADALWLMRSGPRVVFVDTRSAEAWVKSDVTISGAIRVPADEVERHLGEMPRDRRIVTYCT